MAKRPRKNPAAVALGKLGGKARMASLTPRQRSELGRKAIRTRWEAHERPPKEKPKGGKRT